MADEHYGEQTSRGRRDIPAFVLGLGFFLAFFAGLVLVFRGDPVMDSSRFAAVEGGARAGIGVVEINGVIQFAAPSGFMPAMAGAARYVEEIRTLQENPNVRGLVLRINSQGGSVAATQEVYNAVKRFRQTGRPVIASMGDIAASGGYYVACAGDEIFANPGTITGSIGVIMRAPNLSGLYEWANIQWNVIKSGQYKDIFSSMRPMTAAEQRILVNLVRNAYEQFFAAVLENRTIKQSELEQLAQGQIFSGNQAHENGLVDAEGDFEAALARAAELAGIRGRPHIIRTRREPGLGDLLRLLSSGGVTSMLHELIMPAAKPLSEGVVIGYLYQGVGNVSPVF